MKDWLRSTLFLYSLIVQAIFLYSFFYLWLLLIIYSLHFSTSLFSIHFYFCFFFLYSLYFCYLFCNLYSINPIWTLFPVYTQSKHFYIDIYKIRACPTSSVFRISSIIVLCSFFVEYFVISRIWWQIFDDICLMLTPFYSRDDLELNIM